MALEAQEHRGIRANSSHDFPVQLTVSGSQVLKHPVLPGLLPEEQPGGAGGEHGADDNSQDEFLPPCARTLIFSPTRSEST